MTEWKKPRLHDPKFRELFLCDLRDIGDRVGLCLERPTDKILDLARIFNEASKELEEFLKEE